MLPAPRQFVNRLHGFRRLRRDANRLSCSIGEPAFPSRPGVAQVTARSGGDWEERSHPQPRTARCCARAWRGWRAPDLPRSEHRGTLPPVEDRAPTHPLRSVTSRNRCHTYCVSRVERCLPRYLSTAAAPNTILCASTCRHVFTRRCSVRSCPSGKRPGCASCSRSNSSREVRHGSASNHSRSNSVTLANGSGRRRPRGAFAFGLLVGRTSPSCQAVRSPDRNCSSVGAEGSAASPTTGRSASATSSCWTSRIVFSNRTGSSVAYVAVAGDGRPRCSAHRPAIADRAWQGDDMFC